MAKVVHFEIPVDDLDRAKGFYGAVFGWRLDTMEMPGGQYTSVLTTDVDPETMAPVEPGAINGGMMVRTAITPAPVITVDVDDIDAALAQVAAAGGATVLPRTPIPGMGEFAYFTDSEGNVMGLWHTESPA